MSAAGSGATFVARRERRPRGRTTAEKVEQSGTKGHRRESTPDPTDAAMLAGMDRKTAIVAAVPVFAKLEPRSLEAVATLAKIIAVPAETVLMREGEPADSFYVIVNGTVHIERLGRFVRSMRDGGFIGEVALIEGGARTATAICATTCELLEFGSFEFSRVMASFPDVRARLEAAVAQRPHSEAT
jgi:trk system potassium uptake protein TrkA